MLLTLLYAAPCTAIATCTYILFTDIKHSLVSCLAHVHVCTRGMLVHTQCVNQDLRKCVVALYGWGCCYMAEMFYRDEEYHQERTGMRSTIKSAQG